jgi:serine/threonine protein kinase
MASAEWRLPEPIILTQFDVDVTLGTGSFGRVRLAMHKSTGTHWALKRMKKANVLQSQQVEHIMNEKDILATLEHPFVVKMAGAFQDGRFLYLVLEYGVGGEFFTHLRKAGRLDNNTGKFYAAQIVSIFEYLHAQEVIYRDLKPENLLLDQEGYLKITDFGFAKRVFHKTFTLCGTPEYIAPEVLLNKGHGAGVDWWTLGIFIFEILAGQPPFVDSDPMAIYELILEGSVRYPRYFDRQSKNIVRKLLRADLTKRLGCLKGGADDLKRHKWFQGVDWQLLYEKKLIAAIIPRVTSATDTSNFDPYPDSVEEAGMPMYSGRDPFLGF